MANVNLSDVLAPPVSPTDKPPASINQRDALVTPGGGITGHVPPIKSGALTGGTYKPLLSLSAPGVLKLCALKAADATARSATLRLTINGVAAYDATASTSSASHGLIPVGGGAGASDGIHMDRIPFNTLEIAVKSSLTETDTLFVYCIYDLV
jgi:hypothetical protein